MLIITTTFLINTAILIIHFDYLGRYPYPFNALKIVWW